MNMIYFDAFIRFTAVGLLIQLSVLSIRDLRGTQSTPYGVFVCINLIALFLGFTPSFLQLPRFAEIIFIFLDTPLLMGIWLFSLSMYQTGFKLRWYHLLMGVVYCTPILWSRLLHPDAINRFASIEVATMVIVLSVILVSHLVITILLGRSDDLLERRRASRIYYVIIVSLALVSSVAIEIILVGEWRVYQETAKVLAIWPAIVWISYWLLCMNLNTVPVGFKNKTDSSTAGINVRESILIKKLKEEMEANKAYLENGLSISILAKKIGITSHRLRTLINQTLGYDNFSIFVNNYRIKAIKKAFADPSNFHVPILTIAQKFGFNSLSPFNRAFRSIEGITPSQYRKNLPQEKPY